MRQIFEYLRASKINVTAVTEDGSFTVRDFGSFLFVPNKLGISKDGGISLQLTEAQRKAAEHVDFIAFEFGGKFYYYPKGEQVSFNFLKHIGTISEPTDETFAHLGVHSGYEILNGSQPYRMWCEKAKFLGVKALGACETLTISGAFDFWNTCKKNKIVPVIGATIPMRQGRNEFSIKAYITEQVGWTRLCRIINDINLGEYGYITIEQFLNADRSGLLIVLGKDYKFGSEDESEFLSAVSYFQIDANLYEGVQDNLEVFQNYKSYFANYYESLPPVLLNDSYYLSSTDWRVKQDLQKTAASRKKEGFAKYSDKFSKEQYFKSVLDSFLTLKPYFEGVASNGDTYKQIFRKCVDSTKEIVESCKGFEIPDSDNSKEGVLNGFKMPEFEFSLLPERYEKHAQNSETLIKFVLNEGFFNKIIKRGLDKDKEKYKARLYYELEVLKKGGFFDYFLITWDLCRWARENGILVGLGRGSAGGSLVAYLMDIVGTDPLEYDLLFERFLNEGRMSSKLPDVDLDFPSSKKGEIRKYLERKYGYENVVNINNHNLFKIKSAVKSFARIYGFPASKQDTVTNALKKGEESEELTDDLRLLVSKLGSSKTVREMFSDHPEVFNNIALAFGGVEAEGMHAGGIVITPKRDKFGNKMTARDWLPLRETIDGNTGDLVLVSRIAKDELEESGFLKMDALNLRDLDKLKNTFDLVEQTRGEKINFDSIDYTDQKVYDMFCNGYNVDVFQFSSSGMVSLIKKMKPNCLNDLAAANALYRPGTMSVGAHDDYVEFKHKRKTPTYDRGIEWVTAPTYGIYAYQEQVMLACQFAGFTLKEADEIRRAMGKKKADLMDSYKGLFVKGLIQKGYTDRKAEQLWHKLEGFAGYGFNKPHAVAYAKMGFASQYLKTYYPLEFYSTALLATSTEKIPEIISEIERTKLIKIKSADINRSGTIFRADVQTNTIYFSILKIKSVKQAGIETILAERELNGKYFSFQEFLERIVEYQRAYMDGKKSVDKTTVENLILAGAFDEIEFIEIPSDRLRLVKQYYEHASISFEKDGSKLLDLAPHHWTARQVELTGYGTLDYESSIPARISYLKKYYMSSSDFMNCKETKHVLVAGTVKSVTDKAAKNGKPYGVVIIQSGYDEIMIWIWGDWVAKWRTELEDTKGSLIYITGEVRFNEFFGKNLLDVGKKTELIVCK